MDIKDAISIAGIGATLVVSAATLILTLRSNKRTTFVNTVTSSRLKWIDSLRDKVAEFIAVTSRLTDTSHRPDAKEEDELLRLRDTLLHQIVLHLNPHDSEDQRIRELVEHVRDVTAEGNSAGELSSELVKLRDATADYLKKEWNRVKRESTKGGS